MNKKILLILVLVMNLTISACGPGQLFGPTMTPTATVTLTPSATPVPTQTPTPTQTSTPIPNAASYIPVPRWMVLAQPYFSVEILGEKWNYAGDNWGETYACIDYTREKEPSVFFEQCFGMVQEGLTFESELETFMQKDFETLIPKNTFNEVGQIALLAKRLEDSGKKFIKFLEIVGAGKYIVLVEMNVFTDEDALLPAMYEIQVAETIDYVLQKELEKSQILPRPTATPLSPTQESFYTSLAEKLITESEASALYGSTWEAMGDKVSTKRNQVCRMFEDRTNADVLWVGMENCVYLAKDFPFKKISDYYQQPGDTILESHHKYEDSFVIYGYQSGHTYFDAFLVHGEFIYLASLESRTLADQTVNDIFSQEIDDFLYGVLMANVQK